MESSDPISGQLVIVTICAYFFPEMTVIMAYETCKDKIIRWN